MDIVRLSYTSVARLGDSISDWRTNLDRIVDAARRHNAANDITGYLIFDGAAFAQTIEGELAAVQGTWLRIESDHRHSDVRLLGIEPIEERMFDTWRMGFASFDVDEQLVVLRRHGVLRSDALRRLETPALLGLMRELADLGRHSPVEA